jgi:predicted unusual protein kinase regulating ubiquinone biosynthesis (AarF/ABC1/UbiB family)
MEPVLAEALGGSVHTVFRSFDTAPIRTASIGQVYRAEMVDGRDVAVKVQYPKIVAREAANHRKIANAFTGHPFIVVPKPIEELCGPHVIVTEYVDGADFDDLCAQPDAVRDRAGEILVGSSSAACSGWATSPGIRIRAT